MVQPNLHSGLLGRQGNLLGSSDTFCCCLRCARLKSSSMLPWPLLMTSFKYMNWPHVQHLLGMRRNRCMTVTPSFGCRYVDLALPVVVVMRCGDVKMYLADVGGFATHVGSCDDLEPGLPSLHAAVILDEVHALLSLHTRMPASEQDVHLMLQAEKSGKITTRRQREHEEGMKKENRRTKGRTEQGDCSLGCSNGHSWPNKPKQSMNQEMNK